MQKFFKYIFLAATVYLGVCLVLFPQQGIAVAADAITLCATSVIPALFPYLVCSGYLSASGAAKLLSRYLSPVMRPLFGVPGCGAIALVLGTISGYPVGAVCANTLYLSGECTKAEAEKMLAFCNNSGPLFIMSVIGCGFLNSPHTGRLLYISHVFAAILTGILFRSYGVASASCQKALPKGAASKTKNILRIVGDVVDSSVFTMLKICGFVVFFTVFAASIPKGPYSPFLHSFLEITGGIRALTATHLDFSFKLSLISFFAAFSGVSVMLQVGAIASESGLSLKPYFAGKLCQGVFSFFITKILVSRLPQTVDVFTKNAAEAVLAAPRSITLHSFLMIGFALLVLALLLTAGVFCRKLRH